MNKAIVLIGTSHAFQRGGKSSSLIDVVAFQKFISSLCLKWKIQLLAEEMSLGALERASLGESTISQVASSLSIRHQYVDPDSEQRRQLGILEDTDIRFQGFVHDWSQSKIQRRIRAEHMKRESTWLLSLLSLLVLSRPG